MATVLEKLAIDGGPKAVTAPRESRRRFDQAERAALLEALENENLFRYLREDASQVRHLVYEVCGRLVVVPASLFSDLADRVATAGFEVTWDDDFPGHRRFYTADGAGNRVELLASL